MDTTQLNKAVAQLKTDLKNRIEEFNRETSLALTGVIISGQFKEVVSINQPQVLGYEVNLALEW